MIAALAIALLAQEEIRVSAQVEPAVLKLGDAATIVLVAIGTTEIEVQPPGEMSGLAIFQAGRPSTRIDTFIEGRRQEVRRSVQVHFRVLPDREGTFEIPPLRGRAGGVPFETRPLRLEVVADLEGATMAFLEVLGPERPLYRGEVFRIEARFGVRADAIEDRRVRDVTLRGAWFDDLADATRLDDLVVSPTDAVRISVNGRETLVERTGRVVRDGVEFSTWRLGASYVATYPGTISVGSTFLGMGFVREWRQTVFGERVPGRTESMFVGGARDLEISVAPLPEEGQPPGFLGAIGSFRITASAEPADVKEGESIKLTLALSGRGNLAFFRRPDLERAPGFEPFAFFGAVETKEATRREIVYDLAPRSSSIEEIPSIRFDYFDPEAAAYRAAETPAIPVRVRPIPPGEAVLLRPATAPPVEVGGEDLRDVKPLVSLPVENGEIPKTIYWLAGFAPLGYAGAFLVRARRTRRESDPVAWRRERAERAFRRRSAEIRRLCESGEGRAACERIARSLAGYLADRLGATPESILGSDVEGRLRDAGASPDLARAFAALFEECDRSVYAASASGSPAPGLLDRAGAAVRRLEGGGS